MNRTTRKTTSKKTFASMATTYCLGVFNDNYFKQAAMLLAVAAGLNHLQGWAAVLFSLPFILFAAPGGWCADRFSKKQMIVLSKALEIGAMVVGGAGLLLGSWPCILGMVFLMGFQSTFFGPALNGSIPEMYPAESVPKMNAVLKLVTTLAILAGIATAGLCLDQARFNFSSMPSGTTLVAAVTVLVASLGFIASFGIKHSSVKSKGKPFPWLGPLHSLKDLAEISRDRQLLLAIVADTWFYFVASTTVLVINALGLQQFNLSQSTTSLLPVTLMVGICAGSFLAAKLVAIEKWSSHLVLSGGIMGASLLLVGCAPLIGATMQTGWLAITLFSGGIGGGLFLIPITSILQVRPDKKDKGKVIAAAGFSSFCAILLSGLLYNVIEPYIQPSTFMAYLGGGTILFTLVLRLILSQQNSSGPLLGWLLRRILSLRYRVEINGLEEIVRKGNEKILFLPNHPALIDPVIVMSRLIGPFSPRPLSNIDQISHPIIRTLTAPVRPITIPDVKKSGKSAKQRVYAAIDEIVEQLQKGDNILFYPAGRLYRSNKEDLGSNSGVEHIVKRVSGLRVVMVRTTGLWGSSFGFAKGTTPTAFARIRLYLTSLLANGVFFGPRRTVKIDFHEDVNVPAMDNRKVINRHLESWYNETSQPNTHVPYYWWQGRKPSVLPEPERTVLSISTPDIPPTLKNEVIDRITEMAGAKAQPHHSLAGDLGLDSLTIMELGGWLEKEYGVSIPDLEAVETVNDCLLAATGTFCSKKEKATQQKIPKKWFEPSDTPLTMGDSTTVTEAFLRQARKAPTSPIMADTLTGTKSYRQLLTSIFALKPHIEKIEGKRVGIMLPASTTSAIVYLATLFSGKTPVLFNWTAGIANMRYGIEDTGVTAIISASRLCSKIEDQQDVELTSLPVRWLHLDTLIPNITKWDKIVALFKSYFCISQLETIHIPETAAILFTSGSESKPKPVPLSHANIISNLRDFSHLLDISGDNRLLGILPPFHSLGLAGTIIMPLCMGLKTVFYPNPTEPAQLADIIERYKTTMLISTPTFLNGILRAAGEDQLHSLQTVFTGAEKCSEQVRNSLQKINPKAELCEGYGITECSPLVSINVPGNSRPGTIGKVLPSIEYAIVNEKLTARVQKGKQGLLLVRGPNIFDGYLNSIPEKGFCPFENANWYNTGDYVRQEDDDHLVFCGRKKRFIKIGGEMISLPAIENVLLTELNLQNDGTIPLAVEATQDESHPEIVLFTTRSLARSTANETLKKAGLSGLHSIRRMIQVDAIPILGTGKTDYRQLKESLAA
ncbi:MFS transporter [Desulfopila sp. IMCC35008]|uniref:MFS transporter n=1 Tax=Desulfopila sp. IMCC35008 TaxID=2653858 RepID=UPI0013D7414F|nr:MFS transporter [Desulfopila sp. IMCC35008]